LSTLSIDLPVKKRLTDLPAYSLPTKTNPMGNMRILRRLLVARISANTILYGNIKMNLWKLDMLNSKQKETSGCSRKFQN
jgi:hypothetical protein